MKHSAIIMLFLCLFLRGLSQQDYMADKIEVLSCLRGVSIFTYSNKYTSCATFYKSNREYVIYTCQENAYFTDITDPKFPVLKDSVASVFGVPFKNIYVHKNYCYLFDVFDEVLIYDLNYFPDSLLPVGIYQTPANIYNRLFTDNLMFSIKSGTNITVSKVSASQNFVILDSISKDIPYLNSFNFLSERNDTLYASCANKGLFMLRFDTLSNKFFVIDSVPNTNNQNTFYNHFILNNILIKTQYPYSTNEDIYTNNNGVYSFNNNALFLPGDVKKYFCQLNNKWIISYNNVGLFLYNVDDILHPSKLGSFSTYNSSSGSNAITFCMGNYNGKYLIALNNVKGVYILDPAGALKTKEKEEETLNYNLIIFPNPANTGFRVQLKRDFPTTLTLFSINGISFYEKVYNGNISDFINTTNIPEGSYIIKIEGNEGQLTSKIIIKH